MASYTEISNATSMWAHHLFLPTPVSVKYRDTEGPILNALVKPDDNIVGLCTQKKVVQGKDARTYAITFLVKEKQSKTEVSKRDGSLIPEELPGYDPEEDMLLDSVTIPTDVEECGGIIPASVALAHPSPMFRSRVRPIPGGHSIGIRRTVNAGTLGFWAQLKDKGIVGISCYHVLVPPRAKMGDDIVQPGRLDEIDGSMNTVGSLFEFAPYGEGANLIDIACFLPNVPEVVSREIEGIGDYLGLITPKRNRAVMKVGRTTGCTHGHIQAVDAVVNVPIGRKTVVFTEQIKTDCRLESGDSGAALLDERTKKICGICFATYRNGFASFANNIRYVFGPKSVLGWRIHR